MDPVTMETSESTIPARTGTMNLPLTKYNVQREKSDSLLLLYRMRGRGECIA
jgi:hypothetical protein